MQDSLCINQRQLRFLLWRIITRCGAHCHRQTGSNAGSELASGLKTGLLGGTTMAMHLVAFNQGLLHTTELKASAKAVNCRNQQQVSAY